MKILHTADWHFREKDHDEIEKCVAFILGCAVHEKPDLICISGDITDSRSLNFDSRSSRTILNIINSMLEVAPVAIVIGTPSHDGKAALALRECKGKYPVLVSDIPGQYFYERNYYEWHLLDELGARSFPEAFKPSFILTQIPQPTKQYFINDLSIEDTENAIGDAMGNMFAAFGHKAKLFNDVPRIANGHGQIGGAFISETQQLIGHDIEVSKAQLKTLNADLVCYGHIHKAQAMGDGVYYSGSPTRMNYGETEAKGFYVHEIDQMINANTDDYEPCLIESVFIKTPARQMVNIKIDFTDNSQDIPILDYIESMKDFQVDLYLGCHVKMVLTMWQDDANNINQSEIERCFFSAGAKDLKLSIIRKPRETVRAKRVLEADTLHGKIEAMAELRGEKLSYGIIEKAKAIEALDKEPWKPQSI